VSGRQLSFLPETPDEDGNQLDLLEEAGTEPVRPARSAQRRCPRACPEGQAHQCTAIDCPLGGPR
jgi:hypothetical protein